MNKTAEDIKLLSCISDKIANFDITKPYVWDLRLSLNDYKNLHSAIADSVDSHSGSISHLFTKEYAIHTIIYLAEWYKRCYQSGNTDNKAIDPDSDQLKTLWTASGINIQKYVYLTAGGNHLWQYSIYVLGGLAIKHELGKTDDRFLKALCCMLHGENYTLENLDDESRAIAFRSSIKEKHSLYDFLSEIVNGKIPYHEDDTTKSSSDARLLIERIKHANDEVLKKKFRFEWIVNHEPQCTKMSRKLRLWLNPEEVGEGLHHYLRYDRTLLWGFKNPENLLRLFISLRFIDGDKIVEDVNFDKPLISYVNTGEAHTGFVSLGVKDYATCQNIPTAHFSKIEIWAKDNFGNTHRIQEQECTEFMQLWRVSQWEDEWSSRQSSQKETAVLFSKACTLKLYDANREFQLLPFYDRKFGNSVNYGWYNIYDNVTIVDEKGVETTLYNRIGYDQICTKLYHDIIAYEDAGYIKHISESDDEDFDSEEQLLPLIFSKDDIIVRHFATKNDIKNAQPESDTEAERIQFKCGSGYVDWTDANTPLYGVVDLRIFVKGNQFPYQVFFMPSVSESAPIIRDFDKAQIRYANIVNDEVVQSILQDEIVTSDSPITPTKEIIIGSGADYAVLNIIRPTLIREVCRNGKVVKIINNEDVVIPYRFKDDIVVNCFTEKGYQSYHCNGLSSIFPLLSNEQDSHFHAWANAVLYNSVDLDQYAPKCLKVSFGESNYQNEKVEFYKWNYWQSQEPELCEYCDETEQNTIIFQSLANNSSIACVLPTRGKFSPFKYKKSEISTVKCFDIAIVHNIYFFILLPLTKIDDHKAELYEPLLDARDGNLSDEDEKGLLRFAEEMNFDWKEDYKIEI